MGSENSALKRDALEEPPFTLPSGVNIYPAVLQRGKFASVFVYKKENEENVNKAAKHLKTLRHPCLLRFLSCAVETDGIHLVTERVQPLEKVLASLSSFEICAGIYDILQAIVFLHDRGNLTHNNICLSSVFVSEDGRWKLGGMETVCNQNEATAKRNEISLIHNARICLVGTMSTRECCDSSKVFLQSIKSIRDKTSIPPEEQSVDFQRLPEGQGHSRDAYSLGIMVENLLTFLHGKVSEDVLSSFQHTLHSALLNPDPMCRPSLSSLLSHEFFRNDFLEIVSFLNSLTLKSEEEKTEFFKFLPDQVAGFSEELIALRLVPLLLNQLVFAEPVAVKSFLPHLLSPRRDKVDENQINGLLSPAVFQAHVSPALLRLFEVHEEHVRMVLLSHLDAYAELFTQKELKNVILPQVLLGLRDTSDLLVAATLQSLGVLVSVLGPDVVVGGDRTKIFKCTAPSFTKSIDASPEDSPTHVMTCQRRLIYQPLQSNSSILLKCPNPGNLSFSTRNHVPKQDSHIAITKGEDDALHLQSMAGEINILQNGGECQYVAEKIAEEWPDWSECEELESDRSAITDAKKKEHYVNSLANPSADVKYWGDTAHSPNLKLSSGNNPSTIGLRNITELQLPPNMFELQKEFRTLKCDPSPGLSSNHSGYDNRDQQDNISYLPKTSFLERSSKTECGLGEEFMIHVRRKELYDTEQDWFADMIPDIRPSSSALLILPELGPLPVIQSNLDIDSSSVGDAQRLTFSPKFAAAEITEVDGVGWEDEELSWEENANW